MKKNTKKILSELYEIDASFQEKDLKIDEFIDTMIEISPKAKIDKNFKAILKAKIDSKIADITVKSYKNSQKPTFFQVVSYIFWGAWVAVFWFFIFQQSFLSHSIEDVSQPLAFRTQIFHENANSFWSLRQLGQDGKVQAVTNMSAHWVASPMWILEMSGDSIEWFSNDVYEDELFTQEQEMLPQNMENSRVSLDKMTILPIDSEIYVPAIARYTFSWEIDFSLSETALIYKKSQTNADYSALNKILGGVNFHGVDLWKFSNLKVWSMSLKQDIPFWYILNIDFESDTFSFWKNWTTWPQNSWENIQKSEPISEKELLKIVQDFLREYNIDFSSYGTPIVEENYKHSLWVSPRWTYIDRPAPVVIYPFILNDTEIQDEFWGKIGIRVEVDPVEKRVSGMSGIVQSDYFSSEYAMETDIENILKVANVWGIWGIYDIPHDTESEIVEYELTNPQLISVKSISYKNNTTEEFIIPAIRFDIVYPNDEENIYKTNEVITVPLLKDFYKYDENWKIIGAQDE